MYASSTCTEIFCKISNVAIDLCVYPKMHFDRSYVGYLDSVTNCADYKVKVKSKPKLRALGRSARLYFLSV